MPISVWKKYEVEVMNNKTGVVCIYGYFRSKWVGLENQNLCAYPYFVHNLYRPQVLSLSPAWSMTVFTGFCFIWLRRQQGSSSPMTTWGTLWASQMRGGGLFRRGKNSIFIARCLDDHQCFTQFLMLVTYFTIQNFGVSNIFFFF